MLFSQRKGLTPVRDVIQKENIDDGLRNGLWDIFTWTIWNPGIEAVGSSFLHIQSFTELDGLVSNYWFSLFKRPADTIPDCTSAIFSALRGIFFKLEWHEVYDFIEFTAKSCSKNRQIKFIIGCNMVLERELSAYRFVDTELADITSEEEIESIESAIKDTSKYSNAQEHIRQALAMLSDRQNPDYRNSVKESISAVESLFKTITDGKASTLGKAITAIKKDSKYNIHKEILASLEKLYNYTNDASGARHSLKQDKEAQTYNDDISYSDAKLVLVTCSAFVNYMLGKVAEAGE